VVEPVNLEATIHWSDLEQKDVFRRFQGKINSEKRGGKNAAFVQNVDPS